MSPCFPFVSDEMIALLCLSLRNENRIHDPPIRGNDARCMLAVYLLPADPTPPPFEHEQWRHPNPSAGLMRTVSFP